MYLWKSTLILCLLLGLGWSASAQVGINTLNPDTSAILDLVSTNRGFLPPRMTTVERDLIFSPKPGLMVYNTIDSTLQYYNGDCWLNVWQRNCTDCLIDYTISPQTATIDRIFTNTATATLDIQQIAGTPQTIALYVIPNLPPNITATLSTYIVNGQGQVTLTVFADIFAPPGVYPVVVQAICGTQAINQVFVVTIPPCVEVNITTNQFNYDLQAFNNLPTNAPICVVVNVNNGVALTNDAQHDAYTSGNLHPQTQVGINNSGAFLAQGGDGGVGGNFNNFGSPGFDGTDGINLTTTTYLINNGYIFGGGGGGGSVGLGVNIPFLGNWAIGGGGGGAAARGLGGTANAIPIPIFTNGTDASDGINAQPGAGGVLNIPIPIPLGPVSVTVTPNIYGGYGGAYGAAGQAGSLFVNFQVTVPFLGTIFNQSFPSPPPASFPAGGAAGNAIRRNGQTLFGLPDAYYQTNQLKGQVGN